MIEQFRVLRLNACSFPMTREERAVFASSSAWLLEAEDLTSRDVATGEIDALVTVSAKLGSDIIGNLAGCRVICRYGAGVDNVDLAAATEHGIIVMNYPDFCVTDMAEHTMALLLAASRKVPTMDSCTRSGRWDARVRIPVHRAAGLTLGLLGFGRIGRAVAVRAASFGLSVIFHDPLAASAQPDLPARPVSFEKLIAASDFLSLHLPLNEHTRHMISEPQLRAMKASAILINTARGAVVDESALVRALAEGWIAGAALDVFEGLNMFSLPDRVPDHPLLSMPNTVLTPHSGGCSVESLEELMREGARQLMDFLRGSPPRNVVNPEVLSRTAMTSSLGGA